MSILLDGSQARKTKEEKELVFVRTARNGIPVYFVVSLLEISDLGGANADSIKAIDSIFCEGDGDKVQDGPVPLADYRTKVVCATADGANVNVGVFPLLIRQQGGVSDSSTPIQFKCAYRKLFHNYLLQVASGNCEDDKDQLFTMLSNLQDKGPCPNILPADNTPEIIFSEYLSKNGKANALVNVAWYLNNCDICEAALANSQRYDDGTIFIHFKA